MARHLMTDIETGGITPDSVILTLGAVIFDPFTDDICDTLYLKFSLQEQETLGRSYTESTLDWWEKSVDPSTMEEAFSDHGRISVHEALDELHLFAMNCEKFWAQGPQFDYVILEDLYRSLDRRPVWKYHQLRDSRTLFSIEDPELIKDEAHNALSDAICQAVGVQTVMRKLGKSS